MRRALTALVLVLVAGVFPAGAAGQAFLPPAHRIWFGAGGGRDLNTFPRVTGFHPAVWQSFEKWGGTNTWFFSDAEALRSRLMIHISTADDSDLPGVISPGQIAAGRGDGWLRWLNGQIAQRGRPVYVRLFAEMNNAENAYCAYSLSGASKGPAYSTATFRRAWRRVTLILRGGPASGISAHLHRLGMPGLRGGDLPRAPVAMVWVPMVRGKPDTSANGPGAYWPGRAYVDWIGTDYFSQFARWSWLESFWARFHSRPWVLGEFAVWGPDDPGFLSSVVSWSRTHGVRMLMYNQGWPGSPLRLSLHPRSAARLRSILRSRLFPRYAPEWR